ncbi:MAG: plasmid pRiA4b ORF-3 family protein [Parachlamydiaceae bacterium]
MKRTNVKIEQLSDATLRRLFTAAEEFHKLAPWRWMGDREAVAVRDPFSDRIAYCVVMGMEKTCFGLEAMLGDRGLLAYRKAIASNPDVMDMDALHIKDSLLLFLDERKDLSPEDLDLVKKSGMKCSGPHAWPRFRRFEPGFYPWLMNEQDAAFMAVCLEQVAEVAFRAMKDSKILGPRDHRTFVARIPTQKDGKITWRDEFITPEPLERVIRIQPKVDQASLDQALQGVQKTPMIWEADCFFGHMPVADPGERPHYPWCYMIADNASGFIFDIQLADNDYGASFMDRMCEAFKKHKIAPVKVLIRQPHLMSVFSPLEPVGIKTEVVKNLPMIDEARMGMFKAFEQGMFGLSQPKKSAKSASKSKKTAVYQFKVSLNHVSPPVWRLFQVKSDITLHRLATTILLVMEWGGGHLHQFRIDGIEYGIPYEDNEEGDQPEDERAVRLSDIPQDALGFFTFEYDFGDCWEHTVVLERMLAPEEGVKYPVCIDGARSCPPEDCGGVPGYEHFLEAIRNRKHPEHKHLLEWAGGAFDPEEFILEGVNDDLRHIVSQEKFWDRAE